MQLIERCSRYRVVIFLTMKLKDSPNSGLVEGRRDLIRPRAPNTFCCVMSPSIIHDITYCLTAHTQQLQYTNRYINNGWRTFYWSVIRCWSRIQACQWRSRSRWSDIWRSHRCLFTFFALNVNRVKNVKFYKVKADTHYRTYCSLVKRLSEAAYRRHTLLLTCLPTDRMQILPMPCN